MKTKMTLAACGVAALGASALASAATINNPVSTSAPSQLIFYVTASSGGSVVATYSDVLGYYVDSPGSFGSGSASTDVFSNTPSNGGLGNGAVPDSALQGQTGTLYNVLGSSPVTFANLSSSSVYSTFLSSHSGDTFAWGVIGASTQGPTTLGSTLAVVSSSTAPSINNSSSSLRNAIGTTTAKYGKDVATLNTNLGANTETGNGVFLASGSQMGTNPNFYGVTGVAQQQSTTSSSAITLYGLTSSGGTNTQIDVYNLGSIAFNAATDLLTFTPNTSTVPLPPAVWLFGSGLLGLAGVGRRRQNQAA